MEKLRMRPLLAALWIACALLSACGKFDRLDNGGFTEVKFTRSFMGYGQELSPQALDGGIMIYAYSANYVTNLFLSNETSAPTASISLPNGNYSFYAFGYTSSSSPVASSTRCAIVGDSQPLTLDGTAKTVTLNMNRPTCAQGAFVSGSGLNQGGTDTNAQNEFARIQFIYCGTGAAPAITGFAYSQPCDSGATAYQWFGGQFSYKVSIPIFKRQGGAYQKLSSGIVSGCLATTAGAIAFPVTNVGRFPFGHTSKPGLFPLEISAYSESDCSSQIASHYFNDGLIFGPSSGSAHSSHRITSGGNTMSGYTAYYFLIGT